MLEETKKQVKMVRTTLDSLPFGDEQINRMTAGKVTRALPEGVTHKMLYRDVYHIAGPTCAELVLTQLASMVDMIMVSRLGDWATTSVGLAMQPRFLVMSLFMAMNVGATAMVARFRGMDNQARAQKVLQHAMVLSFVMSAVCGALGFLFAQPMISLMGAQDAQTLAGGTVYLQIQMVGMVSIGLSSTVTAVLRGVGDARTAMIYNTVANLVNIVFNYLLIYGNLGFPRMEVAGASLATVIGQTVALVIAMGAIARKNRYLSFHWKGLTTVDQEALRGINQIGMPNLLEQLILRAGFMVCSVIVASLGKTDFAVYQIGLNIWAFSFVYGQALSTASTALVGQSLGRRRPDMAQAYGSCARRIGFVFSLVLAAVFVAFNEQLVALYNPDPYIVRTGSEIMIIIAVLLPFMASQFIVSGSLRGAGDTKAIAIYALVSVMMVRPGLTALLVWKGYGLWGAWLAIAADQMLRSVLVLLRYRSGKWKNICLGLS